MEVPEYFVGAYFGSGGGHFSPEKRHSDQKPAETFAVDDLLDFSHADAFIDNVAGNSTDSSTGTAVDSCNSSISRVDNRFSANFAPRPFGDHQLSGELCVPALRSKLREIGMLMLMPRMLALMAVQRQTATSRSTSPSSNEQQGWSGGDPTTAPTGPLRMFAHTPSFSASLGQLLAGLGLGLYFGLGSEHVKQPLEVAMKRSRLMQRKRAIVENLEDSSIIVHPQS